ncbi:MAG: menaquinone biosynthesis protein [Bacteroidetes bacterium]|nr:menaquinone biosynthesis protein [Bacteroidota bacterium]
MPKLKVTAVSYLNTKPFLYGIFKSGLEEEIDLQLDIPSECARKLASREADLGLVPVAVIPELSNPQIISDYCIGTVGTVKTVCIFSKVPLEELTNLYLDFHSRTSVELVKILLKNHWRVSPALLAAGPGFEEKIGGTTGALIIGDRAIGQLGRHPWVYDLGEAWLAYTGLPFVFAAWVSNRPLAQDFLQRLNLALQTGIDLIPQLMYLLPQPQPGFDLRAYFTENISYQLDAAKRKAMKLFLRHLSTEKMTAGLMEQPA